MALASSVLFSYRFDRLSKPGQTEQRSSVGEDLAFYFAQSQMQLWH